jgi:four helix bundle protein
MRRNLPHERLIVYQKAAGVYEQVRQLVAKLRPPHLHLAEQALRSASSVPLNIAEGACEFSRGDKLRFYRMALRSAGETCAVIDVLNRSRLVNPDLSESIVSDLTEVIAMLTAMTKPREK